MNYVVYRTSTGRLSWLEKADWERWWHPKSWAANRLEIAWVDDAREADRLCQLVNKQMDLEGAK